MTTRLNCPPSALIVHAHPEPDSFSSAQARVARDALTVRGYSVQVIDLYARGWDPVLARDEFPDVDGPFKPQREQWAALTGDTLRAEVRKDLDRVLAADLLVLSFPLWWFSVPAILKGWLDRVFVMGGVSGGDLGAFDDAALTGRRAVVLATTGGPAEVFTPDGAFGDIDAFLFHIHRGVFEFVGYDALEPVLTYGPAHLGAGQRTSALDDVRDAFLSLDDRSVASSSRRVARPLDV